MLIKIDTYEEFKILLKQLLSGVTPDALRTSVIDEVAKDYFNYYASGVLRAIMILYCGLIRGERI